MHMRPALMLTFQCRLSLLEKSHHGSKRESDRVDSHPQNPSKLNLFRKARHTYVWREYIQEETVFGFRSHVGAGVAVVPVEVHELDARCAIVDRLPFARPTSFLHWLLKYSRTSAESEEPFRITLNRRGPTGGSA